MIVEDSPLMRTVLTDAIARIPEFELVATAQNGEVALERIMTESPDLVTLDVELPDMNGLDLLKRIMEMRAPVVVMVSGLTQSCAQTTLRALQLGAADCIGKFDARKGGALEAWIEELTQKLRRAANLRPVRFNRPTAALNPAPTSAKASLHQAARPTRNTVVVVGAGPAATDLVNRFVVRLPATCPPVLIAQQQSRIVIETLVAMLQPKAAVDIKVAVDGEPLKPNRVYFSPGDAHIAIAIYGYEARVRVVPGEPIGGNLPSIDHLFETAAQQLGSHAVGVLLDSAVGDGEAGLRLLAAKQARALRHVRTASGGEVPRVGAASRYENSAQSLERLIELLLE